MMESFTDLETGSLFYQAAVASPFHGSPVADQVDFLPSHLPKRRQNRSCDQCRAGKRACDVQVEFGYGRGDGMQAGCLPMLPDADEERAFLTRWPCSNCRKWRKSCTTDWILSQRTKSKPEPAVKRRKQSIAGISHGTLRSSTTRLPRSLQPDFDITSISSQRPIEHDKDLLKVLPNLSYISKDPHAATEGIPVDYLNGTTGPTSSSWLIPSSRANDDKNNGERHETIVLPSPPLTLGSSDGATASNECELADDIENEKSQTLSPTLTHLLDEGDQRVMIKKNLLKVYHDCMEGALSCWLTERNCPYVYSSFDGRAVWSTEWSNRIVSRVCSLEKANTTKLLSSHNDRQATKVLNLTIMAFAAQWAQIGERSNQRLPASFVNDGIWESEREENFDRLMQKSLWHQASRALLDAAGNPSFKVVFALIIFSLTQRPRDTAAGCYEFVSLQDVLDSDGPPIFLEMALRQLHDHRRKIINAMRSSTYEPLDKADKDTFDLLFWLAIMFDTLSAAIHRRSFVVTDDESGVDKGLTGNVLADDYIHCDLDGWDDSRISSEDIQLWGDYFLRDQSRTGDARKRFTRWPCSYEDAAAALCDAAPVKVLLFRRVGQLQDLKCRPQEASASMFEHAIDAALGVYNHWNQTYGLLITDCINNHEDLPARIQSWYILLAGHWHLAVFILADILDEIDKAGLISISCRKALQLPEVTANLRSNSSMAVSELGRCSRYSTDDLSFSKSKDFHFAVNKAALLTEPWTVVLVRSFGRAGEILAGKLPTDHCSEAKRRLQYCIDALWLLGKKSDMALQAARLLAQRMPST